MDEGNRAKGDAAEPKRFLGGGEPLVVRAGGEFAGGRGRAGHIGCGNEQSVLCVPSRQGESNDRWVKHKHKHHRRIECSLELKRNKFHQK